MDKSSLPPISISLTVKDGKQALAFYTEAFGAEETFRMENGTGGIAHAEFNIGTTGMYLSEEDPHMYQALAMPEGSSASCLFSIPTLDADAAFAQAIDAGAIAIFEPQDQFWGVRNAVIRDPFGYRWSFGQQIEEVSPEEVARRAKALFGT